MQHNAAFQQALHCLLSLKPSSGTKQKHDDLENSSLYTFKVQNGQFHTNCINLYGKIQAIRIKKINEKN